MSDIEKQLKDLERKANRALNELAGPKTLSSLGFEIVRIIRTRTRLGYGVSDEGEPKQRLAPLSSGGIQKQKVKGQSIGGYVGFRKKLKKLGALSDKTSPTKSNLTLSGKMLDELTSKLSQRSTVIDFKSGRSRKIAGYHEEGTPKMPSRPFLNLGKEDVRQVRAFLQDRFNEIITRLFGR